MRGEDAIATVVRHMRNTERRADHWPTHRGKARTQRRNRRKDTHEDQ